MVKSLEAALWAFHDAKDFREAFLRAVNLGDDADTTGAVCGQLSGACWGETGIPQEWREGLVRKERIEEALAGLGQANYSRSASQAWDITPLILHNASTQARIAGTPANSLQRLSRGPRGEEENNATVPRWTSP